MSGSYVYSSPAGVILADTSSILSQVSSEWLAIWPSMSTAQSTPQGLMIAAETASRSNVIKNNAVIANQINPNEAEGVFLDSICQLTGLERVQDTYSTYEGVALAGQPNTPVPALSEVKTPNGDIFALQTSIELDSSGNGIGIYVAVSPGPIAAPAGTLTPYTQVLGLETVTAPSNGSLGVLEQSDVSLRTLRRNTLALQSKGFNEAIWSALYAVNGVIGVKFLENNTNATVTMDGITLVAKSIWLCVDGGDPSDIANAIFSTKSNGTNWNGAQSQNITDPYSSTTYTVKWDVPTDEPMIVQVTALQGTYSGSLINDIPPAVVNFFSNNVQAADPNIDIPGIVVGMNVSPFEIASAIAAQLPGIYIRKVEISLASSISYVTTEIPMAINQKATITLSAINVIVPSS